MSEKTREPTPKRLRDARKKGQVAQSKSLVQLVSCAILFETLFFTEPHWREAIKALILSSVMRVSEPFMPALDAVLWAGAAVGAVLSIAAVGVATVAALASSLMQTNFLVAPEALKPKFDKFNLGKNIGQMFSGKNFSELAMNVGKGLCVGTIVWYVLKSSVGVVLLLSTGTLEDAYQGFVTLLKHVERWTIAAFAILSLVDYGVQRYFFMKSMRMSREEIEKEHKENEGDPHVKSHRRQLAREFLQDDPVARTREEANAVVVNPTHFAVSLSYFPEKTPLPTVVARGQDNVARAMVAAAQEARIPVIRYVWLARTLYASGRESRPIPRTTLRAVATVYRVVQELAASQRESASILEIDEDARARDASKTPGSKDPPLQG
jgi:type III secretion protein U